jgi:hypothetical protein
MGVPQHPRFTDPLSAELAVRLERAHDELEARMHRLGLDISDGWRIREEITSGAMGTVVALRPFHLSLEAPDIEMSVQIGLDGRPVNGGREGEA